MLLAFQKSPPVESRVHGEIEIPADDGGIAPGMIVVGYFYDEEGLKSLQDGEYLVYEATQAQADASVPCPSGFKFLGEKKIKTPSASSKVTAL